MLRGNGDMAVVGLKRDAAREPVNVSLRRMRKVVGRMRMSQRKSHRQKPH